MPIIECGAPGPPPFAAAHLTLVGPTVLIEIGFDPAIITQIAMSGPVPPGGAFPPLLPPIPTQPQSLAPGAQQTDPPTPQHALMQNVPALIDTGAYESCIDDALAKQLQLPLINQTQSVIGVHGSAGTLNVYLAYISIPILGIMQAGAFTGAIMNIPGQKTLHRALIGRTLLQGMLVVYDGRTGSVKLAV